VDLTPTTANALAVVTLTAVAVISIRLNLRDWRTASMLTLEELHCALVLLRRGSAAKSAEVAPAAGSWIDLP
jgi:hypothetical protein